MSNSKLYIEYARKACNYVLNECKVLGANWDQYRHEPNVEDCVIQKKKGFYGCTPLADNLDARLYNDRLKNASVENFAAFAKVRKVGNCEEFSALAFCYLRDLGIKPLHRIALALPGDHVFVTLGKFDKNLSKVEQINDNNSLQWGPDSIICDPWAQGMMRDKLYGVYSARLINDYLKTVLSLDSLPGFEILDRAL